MPIRGRRRPADPIEDVLGRTMERVPREEAKLPERYDRPFQDPTLSDLRARVPVPRERQAIRSPGNRPCAARRGAEARARPRRATRSGRARHRHALDQRGHRRRRYRNRCDRFSATTRTAHRRGRARGCWPGAGEQRPRYGTERGPLGGREQGLPPDHTDDECECEKRQRGDEPAVTRRSERTPGIAPPDPANCEVPEDGADNSPARTSAVVTQRRRRGRSGVWSSERLPLSRSTR